jgi:hypothetical protein
VGRDEGVLVPEGGGGMSVLSTLEAFFLGFGAITLALLVMYQALLGVPF